MIESPFQSGSSVMHTPCLGHCDAAARRHSPMRLHDVELAVESPALRERRPDLSIILPTLNEARNLPILLNRIANSMKSYAYEVVIIDDRSTDGTRDVCSRMQEISPVRLYIRNSALDGLSGAALTGMALARGDVLVVMDADLQHPPEFLPAMVAPLLAGEVDFVVGSRNVGGSAVSKRWSYWRRAESYIARLLVRPLSRSIADPLSGFIGMKHSLFDHADELEAIGYKIGLEFLCKARPEKIAEVPITFEARCHGASKMTIRQRMLFLMHVGRLYKYMFMALLRCW